MPNIPKTERSIFSCNVYRSSHTRYVNTLSNEPEVLYVNDKLFNKKGECKSLARECSTQTSRTILQLGKERALPRFDAQNQTSEVEVCVDAQNQTANPVASVRLNAEIQTSERSLRVVAYNATRTIATGSFTNSFKPLEKLNKVLLPQHNIENPQKGVSDESMSPDSLGSPQDQYDYSLEICPYSVASRLSGFTLEGSCHEQDCLLNHDERLHLTDSFLNKSRSRYMDQVSLTSKSFVEYAHPNYIPDHEEELRHVRRNGDTKRTAVLKPRTTRKTSRSSELPDNSFLRIKNSFMWPTAASQIKNVGAEIQSTNELIPPMRRGKSTSPKILADRRRFESSRKIPYIDQSKSDMSSSTTLVNATRDPIRLKMLANDTTSESSDKFPQEVLGVLNNLDRSTYSFNDTTILIALNKLQQLDWRVSLRGLADIVEICRCADTEIIYDYMPAVHHRLIELLRSPRSHVCRTACQAAGHLFEYVKDTRRPVFDEIVDILLQKTADANKFIRHDANMALDCMVTHVAAFNAVRALCNKGPFHKNALVRCATARLLVCAIVIAGAEFVLSPNSNECTRKKIIFTMVRLMEDKCLETRKLAERIYKVLSKDVRFNVYLKKYLEREKIAKIQKTLRFIHKK